MMPPFRNALSTLVVLLGLVMVGLVAAPVLHAQPGRDQDPLSWDRNMRAIFSRYCNGCHNANERAGEINLASDENLRLIRKNRDTWDLAREMIEGEVMPPEDARQPSAEERELMVRFLDETLGEIDCDAATDPGRPVLRRLTHVEYDNAVFDLTGLDLQLAQAFPPDPSAYGFDNIADALSFSPMQVEQYHQAARSIVDAVLASRDDSSPDPPETAYARTFFVQPDEQLSEMQAARQIVTRFASEAFRRPVEEAFIDKLMQAYDLSRQRGADHETTVGYLLTGILVSPRFLTRIETDRPEADGPYPVDDFELATRLSFFLWSRPPDAELRALASQGSLQEAEVLKQQALRMLQDARGGALVDGFLFRWLGLNEFAGYRPDAATFPEFDEQLRASMLREVRLMMQDMVRENGSIIDLIDARHTYLDARLAKHYGLEDAIERDAPGNADREGMVRVALPDRRRGGVLTSGVLMTLLSDPTRTNIPRRGTFVLGRILGTPPPPPPPDVPELAAVGDQGAARSLREMFELHRASPDCASCHSRIDPFGFGLENYDAIGRWRSEEFGKPIDAGGELVDGSKFNGPVELKDRLLERREQFIETFTRNLLIYALGRGLDGNDFCLIRDVNEAAREADGRFHEIVVAIITSEPFRYRRNPEF